jgi:inorganic triphosphatase YgiF
MSTEIELKLDLTPQTARRLPAHPLLAALRPRRQHLLNTYYDTPDLALHARRVALRFRKKGWQWLLTVKSAEPASGGLALRSEWETPAHPGHFDFAHVDAPALRLFLEAATPGLQPVFTTDFRRTTWEVPFGESVIEMAVDRGSIEGGGRKTPICEIELELLDGRIADLFALTRALQDDLDLRPAIASKAERGYALFLGEAPAPFKAKTAAIDESMSPVAAFRAIALGCLEHFQRNERGLAAGDTDPEYVHQARVALRRLRSALKLFAPALPPDFVAAYGQAWQSLAGALGDARNWDVFVTETLPPLVAAFPEHPDTRRLQREGTRRARHARKAVAHLVALPDYPRVIIEFTAALYALADLLPDSLADFATRRLKGRARQARRLALRLDELTPAERHCLRISFKKLRYAVEFFAPLLPPKPLKRYLAALSRLQDELGLLNDHVTALTLLDEALKNRHPGPIHGWMAGRHELLVRELPEAVAGWLERKGPWG